ncbi:MAG TPA: glycosyltransferase family 2 protein [Sphingomonas sp.]|nr:glycosyltransferase family 2 protein [Sphingomonas sp.]
MSAAYPLTAEFELLARPRPVRIAVVIPCYRAVGSIERVVGAIGASVWRIYCVDDASPDDTGAAIGRAAASDPRVTALRRDANGGVGAAVVDGFRAALADGAEVIVKIDSDGQMAPALIPDFVAPILSGEADYVKGNRFFSLDGIGRMPSARIVGNAGLSFLTKLSTGYWDLFDPANGYVAIHAEVVRLLPLDRLHRRYFFESDMLFRLATLRARVIELPIEPVYHDERSHLSELRCLATFPFLHMRNFAKRLFYNYFLRNFSAASLSILAGAVFFAFGVIFGAASWLHSLDTGDPATAGTVMLSALPLIVGIQLLLNFLAQDVALAPSSAIHHRLTSKRVLRARETFSERDQS